MRRGAFRGGSPLSSGGGSSGGGDSSTISSPVKAEDEGEGGGGAGNSSRRQLLTVAMDEPDSSENADELLPSWLEQSQHKPGPPKPQQIRTFGKGTQLRTSVNVTPVTAANLAKTTMRAQTPSPPPAVRVVLRSPVGKKRPVDEAEDGDDATAKPAPRPSKRRPLQLSLTKRSVSMSPSKAQPMHAEINSKPKPPSKAATWSPSSLQRDDDHDRAQTPTSTDLLSLDDIFPDTPLEELHKMPPPPPKQPSPPQSKSSSAPKLSIKTTAQPTPQTVDDGESMVLPSPVAFVAPRPRSSEIRTYGKRRAEQDEEDAAGAIFGGGSSQDNASESSSQSLSRPGSSLSLDAFSSVRRTPTGADNAPQQPQVTGAIVGEIEYLVDGLNNRDLTVQQSTLCDILDKVASTTFLAQLMDFRSIDKIYNLLRVIKDPLLTVGTGLLLRACAADVTRGPETLSKLSHIMPFVHSFTKIIWHDVAKKTKPKILGRLKAIAQSYHLNFASSSMFLMPGLEIVIAAMAAVSNELSYDDKIRRTGGYLQKEIAASGLLQDVLDTFVDMLVEGDPSESLQTQKCMKVLESGIDRCLSNQQQVVSTPNLLSRLVEYVVSQDQGKDMMMTLGFLRLLVSLTNGNVRATEIIGARQDSLNKLCKSLFVNSSTQVPAELQFEWYILSVGLFVNLVEQNAENRSVLACSDQLFHKVVARYKLLVDTKDKAVSGIEQAEINAVGTYSALLLGLLCMGNLDFEARIAAALEQSVPETLEAFVAVLLQFQQRHEEEQYGQAFDEIIIYLHSRLKIVTNS